MPDTFPWIMLVVGGSDHDRHNSTFWCERTSRDKICYFLHCMTCFPPWNQSQCWCHCMNWLQIHTANHAVIWKKNAEKQLSTSFHKIYCPQVFICQCCMFCKHVKYMQHKIGPSFNITSINYCFKLRMLWPGFSLCWCWSIYKRCEIQLKSPSSDILLHPGIPCNSRTNCSAQ